MLITKGINFYRSIKQWPRRGILKLDKGGINTEAIKLRLGGALRLVLARES